MTDETINLDSVLSDEPVQEAETPREQADEPTGENEPTEQPQGEQEGENSGEPPEQSESVPLSAFKALEAKYKSERDRARQYEEQLAPKQEAPDPVDDPEGYERFVEQSVLARRNKKLADRMRDDHPDYDEKMAQFLVATQINPDLARQLEESDNPAKFGYDYMVSQEKSKEEAILAKHRDSLRQQILEELKAHIPQEEKPKAPQVPNLTRAPAAQSNSTQQVPASTLDDVLGDAPY